ncbi:MAG: Fic family protein [Methanoregula sp.]|jgi:Fic family protein
MEFNRNKPYNDLPSLPPSIDLESKAILKKCIRAHRALASLKGAGNLIPNQAILINAIPLQEAKASSEIENVVTTGDRLYKASILPGLKTDPQTKEVLRYRTALRRGYDLLKTRSVTSSLLREVCEALLDHEVQYRSTSGTRIENKISGEVVYTPPEGYDILREKLDQLDIFIHQGAENSLDPLIRLALIHYQFEAIHPFEDGNGRTGRILNILYLIEQGLLDIPVLYLSGYIIDNKGEYYRRLQAVTENEDWERWIQFLLSAVEETSAGTYRRILAIHKLLDDTMVFCRDNLPKQIYSHELIELIFIQPYCKISFVVEEGIAQRQTAAEYLQQLEKIGVLESRKIGREKIFIHPALLKLLSEP